MNFSWLREHRRWLRRCLFILVGAGLLLWTPLLNGYPLIHADSGTYIWSSVLFLVPVDRPISYGLFIRAASLVNSLWSVVFLQALGTSYLVIRSAELLLPPGPRRDVYAFCILVLVVLTRSVSAQVGLVLADLFASWMFLAGLVVVLAGRTYERVVAGFLMVLALVMHNSHIYIALAVLLVLFVVMWLRRHWWKPSRRALVGLLLLVVIAVVFSLGINLYLRAGLAVGRGGTTFVVNRLEQSGILIRTLDLYCDETHWVLCDSREIIRNHRRGGGWYLWSPDSPLGKLGWEASAAEHASIVRYAVQCCIGSLVETSAVASWRQFWMVGSAAPINPLSEDMNAVLAIQKNLPHELGAFQNSAQQQGRPLLMRLLPVDEELETTFWLVAALSLAVVSWGARQARLSAVWFALFTLLIVNAVIVASASGASVRYQERVFWLVPFLVCVSAVALTSHFRAAAHLRHPTRGVQTEISPVQLPSTVTKK